MDAELRKMGECFRLRREEKGLSLKEVENNTSILSNYLKAIEEGSLKRFPSPVHIQGFIRQYANFLEMDLEGISKQFPSIFQISGEKHDFAYGIGTLEKRGNLHGGVKWLPNLLWAGLSASILFCAWYLARRFGIL